MSLLWLSSPLTASLVLNDFLQVVLLVLLALTFWSWLQLRHYKMLICVSSGNKKKTNQLSTTKPETLQEEQIFHASRILSYLFLNVPFHIN